MKFCSEFLPENSKKTNQIKPNQPNKQIKTYITEFAEELALENYPILGNGKFPFIQISIFLLPCLLSSI